MVGTNCISDAFVNLPPCWKYTSIQINKKDLVNTAYNYCSEHMYIILITSIWFCYHQIRWTYNATYYLNQKRYCIACCSWHGYYILLLTLCSETFLTYIAIFTMVDSMRNYFPNLIIYLDLLTEKICYQTRKIVSHFTVYDNFGWKYVRRQEKYVRILPNYDNILTFEMNVISSMLRRHS